jgi:hypothetical protein
MSGDTPASWERLTLDLGNAIRLGYEAERDDPNLGFATPDDDEILWLASWLVSEGWRKR